MTALLAVAALLTIFIGLVVVYLAADWFGERRLARLERRHELAQATAKRHLPATVSQHLETNQRADRDLQKAASELLVQYRDAARRNQALQRQLRFADQRHLGDVQRLQTLVTELEHQLQDAVTDTDLTDQLRDHGPTHEDDLAACIGLLPHDREFKSRIFLLVTAGIVRYRAYGELIPERDLQPREYYLARHARHASLSNQNRLPEIAARYSTVVRPELTAKAS